MLARLSIEQSRQGRGHEPPDLRVTPSTSGAGARVSIAIRQPLVEGHRPGRTGAVPSAWRGYRFMQTSTGLIVGCPSQLALVGLANRNLLPSCGHNALTITSSAAHDALG